jgi:hypothetical protein
MRNNSTSEEFFSLMLSKTQHNIELRAIENGRVGDRLFSRDIQQIEAFIRKNIDRCNLYFGVSTREGSTGTKEGCRELIWLFCDMDLKDYQNDWTEMDRALESFRYSPSIIINSGNGYHVYWMLKELITDVHSRRGQVEGILKGISTILKSDMSATDISRVLRVPGSLNHKSFPPKTVEITRFEDNVYSLEDFNEFSMPDNTGGEYKDYARKIQRIRRIRLLRRH